MIVDETIDGRAAEVIYMDRAFNMVNKDQAELVKVTFKDNGDTVFLVPDEPEQQTKFDLGTILKRKVQKGRALRPVSQDRPAVRRNINKLHTTIAGFFTEIAPRIIRQVTVATSQVLKADDSDKELIDEVMGMVDFNAFNQLPKRVQQLLQGAHEDAGNVALDHIGTAVATSKDIELNPNAFDQVNLYAVEYAHGRSAEMVGMKYNKDGDLVPNPNAKWAITETTRDGIRSAVADVISGRAPSTELASTLRDSYGFSDARAEMIARTEIHMANGEGALAGYQASGVVEMKVWLTSADDDVSEDCAENEDEGPIPIDDEFPSGDQSEPAHPNCRCTIAPYVSWGEE